jgi:hypothetical protein
MLGKEFTYQDNCSIKAVEQPRQFDVATFANRIVKEFPKSYLLEMKIRKGIDTRTIAYPSLSKSNEYKDHILSITIRTSIDDDVVTYTLLQNGQINFNNYWTHPEFDHFFQGLRSLIHAW